MPASSTARPEHVRLGPFALEKKVGSGGMADVWSGVHVRQNVPVAIKVVHATLARDPAIVTAFRNEVLSVARLLGFTTASHLRAVIRRITGVPAAEAVGLYADFSKQRVTSRTLELLFSLAAERALGQRIEAMFKGERINLPEDRAVLHVALRAPKGATITVDGVNVVPQVHQVGQASSTVGHHSARDGDHLEEGRSAFLHPGPS